MFTESSKPGRPRLFGPALAALCAVTLAGCAGGGGSQNPSPFDSSGGGGDDRVRIEVENLNFNDITIWAVRSGQRTRVGRMGGKADGVFRLRHQVAQPLYFEVQIVSQAGCRTNSVQAQPGHRIWLLVPGNVEIGGRCRAELR